MHLQGRKVPIAMSERAIGTRAGMWSEELQETVDRIVLEDFFPDTKMKVCQRYIYSLV